MGLWAPFYVEELADLSQLAIFLFIVALLLRGRNRKPANVTLAIFTLLLGLSTAVNDLPDGVTDRFVSYNALIWGFAFVNAIAIVQILFVASAIEAPLTRPLRNRSARLALVALAVVAFLLPFAFAGQLVASFDPVPAVDGPLNEVPGPLFAPTVMANLAVSALGAIYSFSAALQSFLRAGPASLERRRAKGFLVGFSLFDAFTLFSAWFGIMGVLGFPPPFPVEWYYYAQFSGFFAGECLLAYALVRWQIFDAELRLKAGIRRGLVGISLVAVFVAVSQLLQSYVSSGPIGAAGGALVAGGFFVVGRPVERWAERVASAAVPHVDESDAYAARRREEVYRVALQDTLSDGSVTARERLMLLHLAQSLGLPADQASRIELEFLESKTIAPAAA